MSKKDKLMARLLSQPKDFTFDEVETLLGYFSYYIDNGGRTSGSKVRFINLQRSAEIALHKPHPQKILKEYQIKALIKFLETEDLIWITLWSTKVISEV